MNQILVYVIASNLGWPQASDLFDLHFLLEKLWRSSRIYLTCSGHSRIKNCLQDTQVQSYTAGGLKQLATLTWIFLDGGFDLHVAVDWTPAFFLWSFFLIPWYLISYDDFIWYLELKIMIQLWYWQHLGGSEQIAKGQFREDPTDPIASLHGSCAMKVRVPSPLAGFQSMLNEALKGNSPVLPNVGWHRSMV